jgi:Tol biopolymer transport system component
VPVGGGRVVSLSTAWAHGMVAAEPRVSPDGSRIVFVEDQGRELVVMRADGSHQHVIARARGYYEEPARSPDGRAIAFQSHAGRDKKTTAIVTIRPDGAGERRLTSRSGSAGFPAWSPSPALRSPTPPVTASG